MSTCFIAQHFKLYLTLQHYMCFHFRFNAMGIIHTARKYVKDEIIRKLRFKALEKRKRVNSNATLSIRDEAQVDFNIICLYF